MRLSKNFHLHEFIKSQTASRIGIDNTPPPDVIENLKYLCENLLQPIRDIVGVINVSSGYRSQKLNTIIGGSPTSQHMTGNAVDFESVKYSNIELGKIIENSGLIFDQLIYEFVKKSSPYSGWIHLSLDKNINRKQIFWIG